ncbi:hypothetical protein CDAR_430581 [Caerostris darwini]|uniref:GON domain-containing protein n=1 Tax=Caerostris darwini TaxID=1538125 RepID=A0AAV4T1E3_9ARAC|nr:hypothetical protein CDAR_430581 [Caerostris darwini]
MDNEKNKDWVVRLPGKAWPVYCHEFPTTNPKHSRFNIHVRIIDSSCSATSDHSHATPPLCEDAGERRRSSSCDTSGDGWIS